MHERPGDLDLSIVFLAYAPAEYALDMGQFYHEFGVMDRLETPFTDKSLRVALHKWMPRACSSWPSPFVRSPRPRTSVESGVASSRIAPPRHRSPRASPSGSPAVSFDLPHCISSMCLLRTSPRISPAARSPLGCSLRILLVESCGASAATLQHYCSTLSCDIRFDCLPTGEDAVKRLSGGARYDLVVAVDDIPGMSPFALCAWYKERHRRGQTVAQHQHRLPLASPPTEFVCLAAEPNPEACAAFGVDHSFAKPLTFRCFGRLILGWLDASVMKENTTDTTLAPVNHRSDEATGE